jgi:hypothetical protein
LRRSHLVLIGGPLENAIAARMADKLPATFATYMVNSFTFRGKPYGDAAEGIKFIYPNPLSPGRYVIVTAANSIEGYDKTSDQRRDVPDWVITDKDGIREGGFFDNRWK